MSARVFVVGDGAWGTALALLLAGNGCEVTLWSAFPENVEEMKRERENKKYLPGIELPSSLKITADERLARGADVVLVVVSTRYLVDTLERPTGILSSEVMVSATKGIDHRSLLRPSQMIKRIFPAVSPLVLSGPSHAEEVSRNLPTAVVLAGEDAEAVGRVRGLFIGRRFRVYTSDDPVGVELGGAFKNVIAIAVGMCEGLGLGDNARAALITRGLQEMRRLGERMGARGSTFFGLSGLGDLITTCISPYGRNRQVGYRLAGGESLDEILGSMNAVAEGVLTCRSVCALADELGEEVPVSREVYRVMFEGRSPHDAVDALMSRAPGKEF